MKCLYADVQVAENERRRTRESRKRHLREMTMWGFSEPSEETLDIYGKMWRKRAPKNPEQAEPFYKFDRYMSDE